MTTKLCSIDECDKPHRARGRCKPHYESWRLSRYNLTAPPCGVEGCENPVRTRGWCTKHYKRWRSHGNPLTRVYERNAGKLCADDCGESAIIKGRCLLHFNRAKKQAVIDAYGGSCVCCGETAFEFLSIDHLKGNGAAHRRAVPSIYDDLKKEDFRKTSIGYFA